MSEAYSYRPPEVLTSQRLDSKLAYASDFTEVTATMIDHFTANPEELAGGRYTEIHLDGDSPLIVISPRGMVVQGASIGGSHSIIEELRLEDGYCYPNFMASIDQLGTRLSTKTILGKGVVSINEATGLMDLKIEDLRAKDLQWVEQLRAVASASGLKGGITLNEVYAGKKEIDLDAIPVRLSVGNDLDYIPELNTHEGLIKDISLGIMTDIAIEPVEVRRGNREDIIERWQQIAIKTNMAQRQMHNALYEHAGITDPMGLIPVQIDGETVMMGLRYTNDKANNYRSINVFYDKQYGAKITEVQQAIVGELCSSALYGTSPLRITTAAGNQLLSDRMIE